MSEDTGGGGPSWAFGSRFSGLSLDQPDLERTSKGSNRGNKRTAGRAPQKENQFTKLLRVDSHNGPRFLTLKRTDNGETMKTVSPFFIRKAMDTITPNVEISRTRDGNLLLKTVDRQQAEKLMKQKLFGGSINIEITEHHTLNKSRGTIFCPDLKMHTDEEIVSELKHEHVTEVKRIKRRNKKGELEDSGAFILTFNLGNLPTSIDAGIHCCRVQQYIPPPLRCMNCLKFGHKKTACKGNQICASCANLYHDRSQCQQGLRCVVCRGDHHALSRNCPVYKDEFEIQRMKVTEKITYREARQKRRLQAPDPNPPRLRQAFSSLFKSQTQNNTVDQQKNNTTNPSNGSHDIDTSEGNSSNQLARKSYPARSRTTDSTQMNIMTTISETDINTLTLTNIMEAGIYQNDQNTLQLNRELQTINEPKITVLETRTNTTTNVTNEIEKNTVDPNNITNTVTESNNLNILSQFITQSINIDEEQMKEIEL